MLRQTGRLRADLSGRPSFRTLLKQVQQTVLDAQDHQAVAFSEVVAALDLERTPGVNPVFQTIFGFVSGLGIEDAEMLNVGVDTRSARVDLTMSLIELPDGFQGIIEYSADLFDEARVVQFAGLYRQMLRTLTGSPETPVNDLDILPPSGRDRVLHGSTSTRPINRGRSRWPSRSRSRCAGPRRRWPWSVRMES